MATPESEQELEVREIGRALVGLTEGFNSINKFAFNVSGGIWSRYGTSGGSLVFGGAVAIVALAATISTLSGWTPEDLITCMGFAVVLIIIGTAAQLIYLHINSRTFKVEAGLYEKYAEAVNQIGRDLLIAMQKGKPDPPSEQGEIRFK